MEVISYVPREDLYLGYFSSSPVYDLFTGEDYKKVKKLVHANRKAGVRKDIERDDLRKQIVTYCVIEQGHSLLATKRIGGDGRLQGEISLGVGGHVRGNESLLKGVDRELKEELDVSYDGKKLDYNIFDNTIECKSVGIISSGKTEVDRCHLGFFYLVEYDPEVEIEVTDDNLEGRWVEDPGEFYNDLETWSQILVDEDVI